MLRRILGGPNAGGLFATEVPGTSDHDRFFDLIVSYDPQLILDAARPRSLRGSGCGSRRR
jgi:hypothetical protein